MVAISIQSGYLITEAAGWLSNIFWKEFSVREVIVRNIAELPYLRPIPCCRFAQNPHPSTLLFAALLWTP